MRRIEMVVVAVLYSDDSTVMWMLRDAASVEEDFRVDLTGRHAGQRSFDLRVRGTGKRIDKHDMSEVAAPADPLEA